MRRSIVLIIFLVYVIFGAQGETRNAVVVDSVTRMSLPSASVFDCRGVAIGITNPNGRLPLISAERYPIIVRYLGYKERMVSEAGADTIFMQENISELPEIVVESRQHKVMHILAYVREYSTLTTYTDTVFLFREKMVDYMLVPNKKTRFKGWANPRVLACKSYYRFTDVLGLDSVSDEGNYHFSWSDWVGIPSVIAMPEKLRKQECGADTLRGKYRPTEIWMKNNDRVSVGVNVLADTLSRKWVPNLSGFLRKDDFEFENIRVRFRYEDVVGDSISPLDISGYSFNIDSNGRGHDMFKFNRIDESFFVSTYAEIYIMDKEYITIKEAKKWDKRKFSVGEFEIYEPMDAPELTPSVYALVERVENINKERIRLMQTPDQRLVSRNVGNRNFKIGYRALSMLKQLVGISQIKSRRNRTKQWDEFKKEQIHKNNNKPQE